MLLIVMLSVPNFSRFEVNGRLTLRLSSHVLFCLRLDVSLRLWLAVCNDKITLQLQSLLSSLEAH